jgi:excisionase family DNA binding protein
VTPVLPRGRKSLRVLTAVPLELLSVRDVAEQLRISRATVYALVGAGRLPHLRLSNAIRIRPEDLEAYVRRSLE